MKESSTIIYTKANKAAWDASAHLHAQGRSWDELLQAASHPDFNVLDDCLTATLTNPLLKLRRLLLTTVPPVGREKLDIGLCIHLETL
jgi:hypothetical protein